MWRFSAETLHHSVKLHLKQNVKIDEQTNLSRTKQKINSLPADQTGYKNNINTQQTGQRLLISEPYV